MSNEERVEVEGYAAVFKRPDLSGDQILPGAFLRGLIPGAPPRVRMLYQHQAETPIGIWTTIREDGYGLLVRGQIFLNSEKGREAYSLVGGGALDGLSIGFKPKKAIARGGGRVITQIDLWEVSIVTFPMSPEARITRVSEPGHRLPRNLLSSPKEHA